MCESSACDLYGCMYNTDGRCIFLSSELRQESARGCHKDVVQSNIEAKHDYEEGLL